MALALGALGVARAAPPATAVMACRKEDSKRIVVGVAADGRFVVRRSVEGEFSGCPAFDVRIHDASGKPVAGYYPNCETREWSAWGKPPLRAKPHESEASLLRRLGALLKLTPLTPSATKVVATPLPETQGCLKFWAIEGAVKLPLWQIVESINGCFAKTSVFEHPSSNLVFVRIEQLATDPKFCGTTRDDVFWLSRAQLEASRKLLRGQQALSAGKLDVARAELTDATRLSPELTPARLGLAKVLAKTGVPWRTAKQALSVRFHGPGRTCRLGHFLSDWVGDLYEPEFASWRKDPSFEAWVEAEVAAHDAVHADNDQNGWYADVLE